MMMADLTTAIVINQVTDTMSDNSYIFCYWDDLGDSQNHVDNQEKSDNKTNNANTGTENGMGILHEQIKTQEDR
jgi:hypothetical protein